MTCTENHDVLKELATAAADPPLRGSVLPWAAKRSANGFCARCLDELDDRSVKDEVAIEDEISRSGVVGKRSFTSTPRSTRRGRRGARAARKIFGASAIKCCYAAAGSGTGAEETGLRAPVSRKTSICDHKGIVVAKKMSRKVSRRVVRPACMAGVRISRPNFRAPCGRTKL